MENEVAVAAAPQAPAMMPKGNASTMVAQTREMAEAIASMQMAKMCPRDVVNARDRILNTCTREKLAHVACYTYARGGTEVTGPSIRLAEAIAQNWGNMQFGIRELEQRNGESTCEAFAWDMETNTRQTKVFQVPHIRHTKRGDTLLTDPRDIYELVANQGARRLRACILGVIPGDIIDEAVAQCELTLKTKCEVTPERLKSLLERFEEFGVTKEQIEKRIQCRLDAMKPMQLVGLGKIYNSLKDGMSKPEDWFEKDGSAAPAQPEVGPTGGSDKVRSALGLKAKEPEAEPEPAKEPAKKEGEADISDLI